MSNNKSKFETLDKLCAQHGTCVHARLAENQTAPHVCVQCAIDHLKATLSTETPR